MYFPAKKDPVKEQKNRAAIHDPVHFSIFFMDFNSKILHNSAVFRYQFSVLFSGETGSSCETGAPCETAL